MKLLTEEDGEFLPLVKPQGVPGRALDLRFLNPDEVILRRTAHGKLTLEYGSEWYEGVKPTRGFPHSAPGLYISLADSDGKEIGLLEDMSTLGRESQSALEEELSLVYFSPVILNIHKVEQNHGATSWTLLTDRGERIVHLKERSDIRWLNSHILILTDVDGVRYRLADTGALNTESRNLLEEEA